MALPIIAIGIGAAASSLVMTVHSSLKSWKWQKEHNEALESLRRTETRLNRLVAQFNCDSENLGKLRERGLASLERAARFRE
jgi:hypothetical protein